MDSRRVPDAVRAPRTQQIRRLIQAVDRAWTRDDSKSGRSVRKANGDPVFRTLDGTEDGERHAA